MYVAIEGPTGVGKTTLARSLFDHGGGADACRLLLDPYDANPFLASQLMSEPAGQAAASLATEMSFLALRVIQLREAAVLSSARRLLIADWAMIKQLAFASLTLHPDDARRMRATVDLWTGSLPSPDVIVYLHADVDTLRSRVRRRGREMESGLTAEYFTRLSAAYERQMAEGGPWGLVERDAAALDPLDASELDSLVVDVVQAMGLNERRLAVG